MARVLFPRRPDPDRRSARAVERAGLRFLGGAAAAREGGNLHRLLHPICRAAAAAGARRLSGELRRIHPADLPGARLRHALCRLRAADHDGDDPDLRHAEALWSVHVYWAAILLVLLSPAPGKSRSTPSSAPWRGRLNRGGCFEKTIAIRNERSSDGRHVVAVRRQSRSNPNRLCRPMRCRPATLSMAAADNPYAPADITPAHITPARSAGPVMPARVDAGLCGAGLCGANSCDADPCGAALCRHCPHHPCAATLRSVRRNRSS